jgi:hypothetical protein
MPQSLHILYLLVAVFLVIFALNVLPAFAPPTWTVLSFISIRFDINFLALALIGAVAATSGRMVLAKFSRIIVRERFLSEGTRRNIDSLKNRIQNKPRFTAGAFLLYAFSPFPSNNLFIAYGLTGLALRLIALPFFIGRVVSYSFWALTAAGLARRMDYDSIASGSFFSIYFVITQIFTLLILFAFTRVDWEALFTKRKLKWRSRNK